jgi:hypothetical protein
VRTKIVLDYRPADPEGRGSQHWGPFDDVVATAMLVVVLTKNPGAYVEERNEKKEACLSGWRPRRRSSDQNNERTPCSAS